MKKKINKKINKLSLEDLVPDPFRTMIRKQLQPAVSRVRALRRKMEDLAQR